MCTWSHWSLFWSSLAFKIVWSHFSSWPKVRVRVSSSWLTGLSEGRGRRVSGVIDDLSGSSISCHASLRCSFVCAHLQTDDISSLIQLLLWKISPVLLGLPAHTHKHTTLLSPDLLFVVPTVHTETSWNMRRKKKLKLTYGTSWGLLCNFHHSLWRPDYLEPSGSSGQQPDPCLKTHNNCKWTKHFVIKTLHTFAIIEERSADCLTFKEVYSLEHVSFGDSIVLCSFEKHGDLLHLLECHAGALDGLDGLVGSTQAVDELWQHLGTQSRSRSLLVCLYTSQITMK